MSVAKRALQGERSTSEQLMGTSSPFWLITLSGLLPFLAYYKVWIVMER